MSGPLGAHVLLLTTGGSMQSGHLGGSWPAWNLAMGAGLALAGAQGVLTGAVLLTDRVCRV